MSLDRLKLNVCMYVVLDVMLAHQIVTMFIYILEYNIATNKPVTMMSVTPR